MKLLICVLFFILVVNTNSQAQIESLHGRNFVAAENTASSQTKTFRSLQGNVQWSIDNGAGLFLIEPSFGQEVNITFLPPPGGVIQPSYILRAGDRSETIFTEIINQDPPNNLPIDLVFVIDVSGSMADPAICTENTTQSKMDYLKNQLSASFMQLQQYMRDDGQPNRLGIVTFSSASIEPVPLELTLFSSGGLSNSVSTLLGNGPGSIQASGATSLGAGIQRAISMLMPSPGYTRQKYILVFTNGIQNTAPLLTLTPTGAVELDGDPLPDDVYIIPYAIFTPDGIYRDILNGLASNITDNDGELKYSPLICSVGEPLVHNWVNAAANIGSPKIVDYRSNRLSGINGEEIIKVNENMDRFSISINATENLNISDLTIEKNIGGAFVPITLFGNVEPVAGTSAQRIFTILFTPSVPGGAVSGGEYRVRFKSSKANALYNVVSIVDDRGLKHNFFASPIVAAGETMFLGTRLFQGGTPVTNANVSAIVYQPKKSLGTGFARQNVPAPFIKTQGPGQRTFWPKLDPDINANVFYRGGDAYVKKISITHPTLPSFQDASENGRRTIGEKKHVVLLHETNYKDIYAQEIVATIPLTHVGNGVYRAKFTGTQKSGLYHVRFEAQGTHPVIGSYLRFEEKTPLVVFGTPDKKRSELCVIYEKPTVLMLRPIDIEGNLLGPNQVDAIEIQTSNGTASTPVDYLDGRYTIGLFVPQGSDPHITIRIKGRTLYDGPLSKICRKRWFLQLGAGRTTPEQTLELDYQGDWFGEAKLGYRLNLTWYIQAKGGLYHFKGINTPNTRVAGLNLGVAYRIWTNYFGGLYLNPELNAGFYQRTGQNWKFGYNYGLGLHRQLSHRLDLVIQYGQHAFDQGAAQERFSSLGAGLRLKF